MTMKHTRLGGGLDLVTPSNSIKPGSLLFSQNYECPIEGGYRPIAGYADLGLVPGEGDILGVAVFDDAPLAIRKQVGVSTASMFKHNGTAWVLAGNGLEAGRYSFDEYAFKATVYSKALYMVGGGKPWKYDGSTLTQITTAPAGAKWIKAHNFFLFLGFEAGSIQHSGVGNPTDWDAANTGEIGTSDKLNGLSSTAGGVLICFCQNSIQTLYGSSRDEFVLKRLTANSGAKAWTISDMAVPFFVSDRGVQNLQAVQTFGDFASINMSSQIDPIFTAGFSPIAAIANKTKSQYRLFEESGRGIYLTTYGSETVGATMVQFPHAVTCAYAGEYSSGVECSLFGSNDGHVYQLDTSDSFAGQDIVSAITLAFNTMGSPIVRKRFRRVFMDVQNSDAVDFFVLPQFDGGDGRIARHRAFNLSSGATGGFWGVANWNEFVWSGAVHKQEPISIAGTATSLSMTISSKRNGTSPHLINGYTTHYEDRRIARG